ncbi:hypothetical protein VE04_02663 [Pseudogymnoascus sp. 24MN13]|nr:hypothetical protein VE04_02663 [Pseudogymnoascus sp. 24MN13]
MASWLKRPDVIKAYHRAIRPLHAISDSAKHARDSGVCQRLKSRPSNSIYDKLRHDKSSPYGLLELTLAKFLPDSVNRTLPKEAPTGAWQLPAGYHLVFFPPPTANLLDDGTDDMHFPGKPWAQIPHLQTPPRRCVRCNEHIKDAVVKGSVGNEKVWVDITRAIGPTRAYRKLNLSAAEAVDKAAIIETRNLVFMPAKTPEEAIDDVSKPTRIIKPTIKPDFSVSIVPDANLLFRFSALTFNAHRIHLDREYARTVEGFRNLVVHGPLSILLMLKVLSSQMRSLETGIPQMVKSITYKNLTPLFADEKMTICVRRQLQASAASTEADATETPTKADSIQAAADSGITKWDVWIENAEGGYAVKGTAETVTAGYASPTDPKRLVRLVKG